MFVEEGLGAGVGCGSMKRKERDQLCACFYSCQEHIRGLQRKLIVFIVACIFYCLVMNLSCMESNFYPPVSMLKTAPSLGFFFRKTTPRLSFVCQKDFMFIILYIIKISGHGICKMAV